MSIKVLIVDDDPMVAHLHERAIKALPRFCVVGIASNGKHALQLAEELKPHLVILDVYMPEVDGIEMLRQLRTLRYPTDVILITAARETEKLQEATRYGALDFIIKPFKLQRLQDALQAYEARFDLLQGDEQLSQPKVDRLLHQEEVNSRETLAEELPKGLNQLTLYKIVSFLKKKDGPLSAEAVAAGSGVSRITARRYLEHLVEKGMARVDLSYGTGRPSRQYSIGPDLVLTWSK